MDREIMMRYDAEIAAGGTADSVILRTVNALVAAERERCIDAVMWELDSNGQAKAIELKIRGLEGPNV